MYKKFADVDLSFPPIVFFPIIRFPKLKMSKINAGVLKVIHYMLVSEIPSQNIITRDFIADPVE